MLQMYLRSETQDTHAEITDIHIHEMVHAFPWNEGHRPIMERSYQNNTIKPYASYEWQTKAIPEEIMIPYEITKGMP